MNQFLLLISKTVTFNILHFDGDILIHLACYAENSDGTCSRDKTEVTVLGRTRQLTESVEEKLDDLMRGVCLKKEDLVPTQETGESFSGFFFTCSVFVILVGLSLSFCWFVMAGRIKKIT